MPSVLRFFPVAISLLALVQGNARAEDRCTSAAHAAARSEADAIFNGYCDREVAIYDKPMQKYDQSNEAWRSKWIEHASDVDAKVARYQAIHDAWTSCDEADATELGIRVESYREREQDRLKACTAAPPKFASSYHQTVDELLGSNRLAEAKAALAKGGTWNAEAFANDVGTKVIELQQTAAKLGPKFRYKEGELAAALAMAGNVIGEKDRIERAEIDKRGCPPGAPLRGAQLAMIKQNVDAPGPGEKQIIRQAGPKFTSRDGQISKEGIPVVTCFMTKAKGRASCSAGKMTIYREKPPNGPWTSWQVSVGVDEEINCKKMR